MYCVNYFIYLALWKLFLVLLTPETFEDQPNYQLPYRLLRSHLWWQQNPTNSKDYVNTCIYSTQNLWQSLLWPFHMSISPEICTCVCTKTKKRKRKKSVKWKASTQHRISCQTNILQSLRQVAFIIYNESLNRLTVER